MVKQTMIRKNPAFNESYYGFATFSKLLEEAAKQKIVTLARDEKSGTYVITSLVEEGGRPSSRAAPPSTPPSCPICQAIYRTPAPSLTMFTSLPFSAT